MLLIAVLLFIELMAFAGRYGYHRDEMYFIVAGGHPAFGYPDQPPLVPLLAWSMHALSGSLSLLRLPSALAAAGMVVVTGATAREAGAGRRAQVIAAGTSASAAIVLATGHFVTTTTFDVLSTSLVGWFLTRAVIREDPRQLLWAGLVVGVGFEAKPQVAFIGLLAVVAFALVGPRWILRSRQLRTGVAIAAVIAAPYVIWQLRHGTPQLTVAGNIGGQAEGGRAGFIPFQLVLVSPVLVPVWISGLVAPWRRASLRPLRFLPVLYGLAAVAYIAGNGKAYYLASLYPTLIAVGSIPAAEWLTRGNRQLRMSTLAVALVASVLINAVIALPLLPERKLPGSASIGLNPDLGETVGWPQFINAISTAWRDIPTADRAHAAIFTQNYGEAGAIDVLGGRAGLPRAFSGHNAFSLWGQPKPDQTTTVVIGYGPPNAVSAYFTGCRIVDRINNPVHLDNDEYGDPVLLCSGLTAPWSQLWPRLRHFD